MRVEWGDPARKLISLPKQPGAAHTPFARRDWLQAGLGRPVNVTPYTSLQVQTFATPFYSEHATSGSGQFALSYAAHRATVTRGSFGSWASKDVLLADNAVMTAFGRAAYAHDWQPAPQANATFLGLVADRKLQCRWRQASSRSRGRSLPGPKSK